MVEQNETKCQKKKFFLLSWKHFSQAKSSSSLKGWNCSNKDITSCWKEFQPQAVEVYSIYIYDVRYILMQ